MTALWTIVPIESLLADESESPKYRETNCAGTALLVEDLSGEECKVVRILSTDPMDYLTDQLQPGMILRRNDGCINH